MRYLLTDSGGCPSEPVASRPAMQEPGTARGGDGESRHTGRGLHGIGAQGAADPRLHPPPRTRPPPPPRQPDPPVPGDPPAAVAAGRGDLVRARLRTRRHPEPPGRVP